MRRPLVLIPQFFGSLIFDRRTSRYLPFDRESTDFLKACTQRSAFELIAAIQDQNQQRDFIDFYDHFARQGYFSIDGLLAADVLDVEPPADHFTGPLAVHLEIIGACNLACTHCFAGELPRNENPLSLAEIDDVCGQLAGIGAFRLGLTGGEPLMREDFFDILDTATDHGLHPCLTTNGLYITDEIAREFGKRDLVWLNVSLDGATAETNDAIRGMGTFDEVLERLRILGRHTRFTLAFTITKQSAEEVEACVELAREVGAHTAVFRPVYPTGTALRNLALMPTFQQYTDALVRIEGMLEPDEDTHGMDPFSPQSRSVSKAKILSANRCGAANHVASISVQGDVNPCSFLGTEWNSGNIRERSFREIWDASHNFVRMRAMSDADNDDAFAGGCRARSLAFEGDVNRPDPWHKEFVELNTRLDPLANLVIDHE